MIHNLLTFETSSKMELYSEKVSTERPENSTTTSFYNESTSRLAPQTATPLHTEIKPPEPERNKYRVESNFYVPIVGTWALRNIHSFQGNDKSFQETPSATEPVANEVALENVKNEFEEKTNSKEDLKTPDNDITNSPYSIKNLTSHLSKKPKLSQTAFKPTPKYSDYAYITNSNFFRKYLSSQLGQSHKLYDPRSHNYPAFYFPTYASNYFHNAWHKTPYRAPTPTK